MISVYKNRGRAFETVCPGSVEIRIIRDFARYHNCSDSRGQGHRAVKDNREEDAASDTIAASIAAVIREHVNRARQRAEASLTEAIAANMTLRKERDDAEQKVKAARADLSTAEAERKAMAAQHKAALAQVVDVQSQLKRAEQKMEDLEAERLELEQQLKDAITAKAAAERQYQQLVDASEQLTSNLARTLSEQRTQNRAPATAAPKRADAATLKSAPVASAPTPAPAAAKKKPIQFPGPARDAKRVRMRQGTFVSVDGMPGQLIDLSLGGAQIVLTQMVKPNQVVRATIPTAGERIICRGRIVWVVYEQPETSVAVYRTGMKFTDVDTTAIEDFMKNFCDDSHARVSAGIA